MNYLITADEFKTFVDAQIVATRARLVEKPTSLLPMMAVLTRDQEGKDGLILAALDVEFNEADEKRTALMAVGRKVFEARVVPLAVSLSCEAWVTQQDKIPPGCEPRHSAQRQEAAILIAASMGNTFQKMDAVIVARDEEGRMIAGEDRDYDAGSARSFLLNYFFRGYAEAALK